MNLLKASTFLALFALANSQFTFPHFADFGSIEMCRDERNCVEVEDCPGAVETLKLGIRPGVICGFNDKRAKICCGENPIGEITRHKCREYNLKSKPVVRHGELGSYPHMAALGYGTPGRINWACVGTLISEKFVLTSAQCLDHHKYGQVKVVRLGDINLNSEFDDKNAKNYKIKQAIPHPFFKLPELYHDLGLIELKETVEFNEVVRPACLESEEKVVGDLFLAGWENAGILKEIAMTDYTEFALERWDLFFRKVDLQEKFPKFNNETTIVADMFFNRGPCQTVDDGSPLGTYTENSNNGLTISGITSLALRCEQPGIFIKVVKYLPWIEKIVWT